MDPTTLTEVLGLSEGHRLRPAKVMGYMIMLCGPYPALLDAPGERVTGVLYEVQSPTHEGLLRQYESNLYRERACLVELSDGSKVLGKTFG